jgi:hypothetical protein
VQKTEGVEILERSEGGRETKDTKNYCLYRLLTDFHGNRGRTIENYGAATHLEAEEMMTMKYQYIRNLLLSQYLHVNVCVTVRSGDMNGLNK